MSVTDAKEEILKLVGENGEVYLPPLDLIPLPDIVRRWRENMEWAKAELLEEKKIAARYDNYYMYVAGPQFDTAGETVEFPTIWTTYAHRGKDGTIEELLDWGFPRGWVEKHAGGLAYVGYEIAIDVEVQQNGKFKIVKVYEA